ncbi:MAG: recombinase RecA [Armatimonadetes bacterium]|nr:recombinase RecA [Armatimonadota bacterium]NIM23084.1 recombinase RecA [Armatimonadota bacterium]NIM66952.1 recombinase RecA [Armatimonadota bacterium]NIM75486.1 recombinase RecA [Armatimonadota bacterium]NIN05143.1 recombinase RecA [Armatimonadota bacterium]
MTKSEQKKDKDPQKERGRALDSALSQIERQFGKGAVMRLGDGSVRTPVEVIPTGALTLDLALGVGGIPRGRIVEIYGNEASGKTTLAYHIIASTQKAGGTAAFIDVEHAMDPDYARNVGVDLDNLLVSQPDTGEQALDIADMLVRSGAIDCFVLDSVAALLPKAELEGEMGDSFVGLQARLMSKALRKLAGSLSGSNTAGVFINQLREKVGVMFGNPEITPGGRALKFWASVRIELRRVENLKVGGEAVGARTRAKITKNKVAAPFRQAEVDIIYGKGISRGGCLLDLGLTLGLVSKHGAFFSFGEERLGQGRENARQLLETNPEIADKLEAKIREKARPAVAASGADK